MFNTKICFVLGAGISKPFGFPIGRELQEAICNNADISSTILSELLYRALGRGKEGLPERFMSAFRRSGMYSIDNWLEINQDDADLLLVGKIAIACIIMNAETIALSDGAPVEGDWFAWLWNNMATRNIDDLVRITSTLSPLTTIDFLNGSLSTR